MKETTPTSRFRESKEYFGDITEKEIPTYIFVYQGCTEYSLATASVASLV